MRLSKYLLYLQRADIMRTLLNLFILASGLALLACNSLRNDSDAMDSGGRKLGFEISVIRDGVKLPTNKQSTKAGEDSLATQSNMIATMDVNRPFALIGIEEASGTLLLDNVAVYSNQSKKYQTVLDNGLLEIQDLVQFSAYYPHVRDISYEKSLQAYSIPYALSETEAGPLVSKTVERSLNMLNTLPLEFRHITNDIGFKVYDVTPWEDLQGLIHLKKLTAYHVASAGVYVNDILLSRGIWNYQGYYRDVVVFEGDAPVGVGTAGKRFVGQDALVESMDESHRFYAIPDEIEMGLQHVEVLFDVDGFKVGEEPFAPLKDQVMKFMIYGVLPGNTMEPGKQYTFHLGLDLSSIYHEICFAPSVSGWETKIYESNTDF